MTLNKELLNPYILSLVGTEELANAWWSSPNRAFNLEAPENVDLEILKDYLMWHCQVSGGS